ncbi:MAG: DHA2 family efflux MFS transporter permease subunit [Sphingomonas sp.]|uniref:DHA2 family efflux MFS transporter permease subunit n=1 Tax=Sphingomonas sp. TaxID=28214 RepID=UPI002273110E|nr:DHA2 family efflux MFS transporter permease subunit [Sphingomonas sp.]MCX8477078.1 DHA2 family efflux MFS transporter permease subunit [Sphingomonas sp.]
MNAKAEDFAPLTGARLLLAGFVLAMTNFMVVLDTTIANVSVPHIAGSLGISSSQGTWIITSYAVAEAVCVPLTGWLAGRFGTVRTFTFGMIGFGLFSLLCGMSTSLGMLVACRIGQGLCGGPLMPLSQTLLMRIFKPEQRAQAMGVWAMTTVTAPILGPILGGTISDSWSWHWIFFINIPVAALCAFGAMRLLAPVETSTEKMRIDGVGLALMLLWIGALQIMLDLGREHDWFNDPTIIALAVIAAVGLVVFLAWELTEDQPIVDLRVFRHRGFTVAVTSLSFAFATFFASAVIIPQWLQTSMGYTATYAGYATAFTGVAAVIMSPIVAKLSTKVDPRALVCFGILWLGVTSLLRVHWNSGADFWTLALPQLLQGFGMPFFFIPLTTLALAAVEPEETASAAGVMSFLRTMAGAIGTSISATIWDDSSRVARSEIVSKLNTQATSDTLAAQGFSLDQIRGVVVQLVDKEALAVATTHVFLISAVVFALSAMIIWLTPRPTRSIEAGAAH